MAKTTKTTLSVEDLVLDGGTQSRAGICEEAVEDYSLALDRSNGKWPFPPIEVFHDGSRYLVASGFHRTLAARRCDVDTVPCVIHSGTAWDAFLFGIKANATNALRTNREDKRYNVEQLLASEEYTQVQIAELVGVTTRTVQRIVAERRDGNPTLSGSSDPTMSCSDDPFDEEDPFGVSGGEDDVTDSGGHDAQDSPPPDAKGNGTEDPEGPSRTPAEEFRIQKAKTVKTIEAAMRAFCDMNDLKKSSRLEGALDHLRSVLNTAQNWPK